MLWSNEEERRQAFPICRENIFLAHAAVTALPQAVADAMVEYTLQSTVRQQEFDEVLRRIARSREACARLIGAEADEIALLGPTSLGLSLFANGLDWQEGDEVLCYFDDYPANVYPWLELGRRGVSVRFIQAEVPGEITPEIVERALGPKTRLVALASCSFLTGFRIEVEAIGRLLHERGVLFSLDGIQTLGAFPVNVEHVDFLSADAHKWLLGPMAAGIVYVKKEHFDRLRPTLLGAWNVQAPQFITQPQIRFVETARRYEPGVLNTPGIFGMLAAIELLLEFGIENVASNILRLRTRAVEGLRRLGFEIIGPAAEKNQSGILTFSHPEVPTSELFATLTENRVIASQRFDRAGRDYLRISPHFYNTEAEIDQILAILQRKI